jgi:tryptophan halogenase
MSAERVRKIVILGGGSAGFLTALTFLRTMPDLAVTMVRSPNVPVIGVGESTTTAVPRYIHEVLGLDRKEFFDEVRPSWKLGIRYEWGAPEDSHFNYTFDPCMEVQLKPLSRVNAFASMADFSDSSPYWALMDRGRAPCMRGPNGSFIADENPGYHIENKTFIAHLERKAVKFGLNIVSGDVVDAARDESGDVTSLKLEDGQEIAGDLFVDCSGFRSFLLREKMEQSYIDYSSTLFCNAAVVGSWKRDDAIRPYTTAETMDHGWCWRIDFEEHVTRGYVFSQEFCSDDEAMREMKEKNPQLGDDLRIVRFKTGRYEKFWVNNVVAIGNASGFVEPLEATALHLVIEQLRLLRLALSDGMYRINPALREVQNQRFAVLWDDVRDFLAVHYKYNRRLDTPFWKHCQNETDLAGAAELVDLYYHAGPSAICDALIPNKTIFGFNGYLTMFVCQRIPTKCVPDLDVEEKQRWEQYRKNIRERAEMNLLTRDALKIVNDPRYRWSRPGV